MVFADGTFALKGGTAINLFVREMPRLSVDLDLVFTDYSQPRDQALQRINEAIRQSAERLLSNHGRLSDHKEPAKAPRWARTQKPNETGRGGSARS